MIALTACRKAPAGNGNGNEDQTDIPTANTVCPDAPIFIATEGRPELGNSGKIRVYKESGTTVVDEIDLADLASVTIRDDGQMIPREQITDATVLNTFHDKIPGGTSGKWRVVHYTPLRVTDKGLEIRLHSGALSFDGKYTVKVDAGVILGGDAMEIGLQTKPAPSSLDEFTVKPDGKGDFCTVQAAINFACRKGKDKAVTISIAPGTYPEMLYLRDKNNITLKGTGRRTQSIIAYANNESYELGSGSGTDEPKLGKGIGSSGGRSVILVENCNHLTLENLTIKNTFGQLKGQAETIYFNSGNNTHRLTIENCELWSFQDTFLTKGIAWVHGSLIAGHCDYIWGYPAACLFEDCEIRSLAEGYIVQARIQKATDKGFVFLGCRLTSGGGVPDGKMALARSGGDSKYFDNVTFVNCTMFPVISKDGWNQSKTPNPSKPTATSGWKEFGSKDPSGNPISSHSNLGLYLSEAEAAPYSSRMAVLGF